MITRVEALNFRCLRYVHRPMNSFHVLVGPNASGKTTFLDVIGILGDIVSGGLDYALSERTPNPQDLLFGRRGSRLELRWRRPARRPSPTRCAAVEHGSLSGGARLR